MAIELKNVSKSFGGVHALSDVSLSFGGGKIYGLLGPNGAGKTTTTLMLLGLTEPTEGSAAIEGVDCTRDPIRVKRAVGYLPDNMGFYPDMTGRENLRMTGKMNEMMSDMGTTMIAGMLVSTVITLLFTPVYYCVIDDLTHRRERRKAKKLAAAQSEP